MCKLNTTNARRLVRAAKWAEQNKIDLTTWDGGLEDFAEALEASSVIVP